MKRSEISDFFRKRDTAWQGHDADALAIGHAEDGEIESPLWGKIKGRSAIHKSYVEWYKIFPDAEYITECLLIDRDRAAQFIKMTGTQQRDFCGLAPTGKRVQFRLSCLFYFTGGKIANEIRIYDFTGILLQLGVLKAKPAF
ncbi:MAG: ester cyclase [Acidobacteria bacterium]|nr:ester cyclase [Acidobacteriota bacterium]